MATTRGKGTHKADSGPEVRHLGSRKGSGAEKKSAIAEKEKTHHSEHQLTPPKANLEQPQKGRGRPRKVAVVDAVPTINEDPPRKRIRNDAEPANEVDNQPAAKRSKADNAGIQQVPRQQRKADDTRKLAIVPRRDPLPDRTGRNVHPGPKKSTRRSHQEVEAEREAKAKATEEQIRKLETAKHLLAVANASEDIENDAMDQNPQRLSTVIQKGKRVDVVGDSDVDEMNDTSEDEEPVKQKVVSVNLRQKAQKTPTDWKHV
jgi:hypothetical protein